MRVCSPAAAGVAGKVATEQQVSLETSAWRCAGPPKPTVARVGGCRTAACSMRGSAGSVQASPDGRVCSSHPKVMTLLREAKEARSLLSPKAWMEPMGWSREKPRSLAWLLVCSESPSVLAETLCGPSAAKRCENNALVSLSFACLWQVIEKVRQITEENRQSHEREKCLQEELSTRLSKEKEVSENLEAFQKSLRELQVSC